VEGLTLIDARAAIRAETGGVERWARELAVRLPHLRPSGYAVAEPPRAFAHRLGQPWEQCVLPLRASRIGASAILCPANLAPVSSKRTVVIIHDAAPLRYPGDFSATYTAWQRFLLPRLVRNALAVITPSEFSRQELIDLLDADPERVHVVEPGVPDELFIGKGAPAHEVQSDLASQYGITGPYVLTVASKVKRKNLGALEPVAEGLAQVGISMVAVGGGRPQLAAGAVPSGVRQLGPVPAQDLKALYSGASAFVLPSLYEGFGLPICEAMACRVPVVCSDRSALPEAAGGAAVLVDPDDTESLVANVLSAATDDPFRQELISKGLERVQGLTWEKTARGVDAVVSSAVRS